MELLTDQGVTGLGEATLDPVWNGEEAAGTVHLLDNVVSESIRGLAPSAWNEIHQRLRGVFRSRPFLSAAMEMACLDAVAKFVGVPVVDLLGGSVRAEVDTKFVLPAVDSPSVRAMASELEGLGITAAKVKVGLDPVGDIDRVMAVREIMGEQAFIAVDANEGWSTNDAKRVIHALNGMNVSVVEQPVARGSWGALAWIRAHSSAAVLGDESIWTLGDLFVAASEGALDAVSVYPGKCGGIRQSLMLARAASALGMAVTFGSNLELGVGTAALIQAACACPELSDSIPSDVIGPLYHESSLLKSDSFVEWSRARLPGGVGLGVELDQAALAEYGVS